MSESIHQSKLSHSIGHLATSTVSIGTSIVTSTHLGISISTHSTVLTYLALSTYSSCLTQHSIDPFVPTSSSWYSIHELTRRSYNCR